MRHGLGRHRSHAEQQGPHSTQTVSVSLLIYSTRFPFAFFFCRHDSSVGAESHQLWPPSQKVRAGLWELCQGRFPGFFDPLPKADRAISAVAVAARWPSYDFLSIFFFQKIFIYLSQPRRTSTVAGSVPSATVYLFFSSLLPSHIRLGLWFRDFPPLLFFVFFSPRRRRRFRPYKPTASTHNDGRQPRKS